MASLRAGSLAKLGECHPDLVLVVREMVAELTRAPGPLVHDVSVLCGHRGQVEQDWAYKQGNSKLPWPKSKHNSFPSRAVDLAPYPLDWSDLAAFGELRARMQRAADVVGVKVRFISWDWPHTELA